MSRVAYNVVKPDRAAEFRELMKVYSAAAEKGGAAYRHVWRNASNPNEYAVILPMENYAQLDSGFAARRGMSDAEWSSLAARRRQCLESVRAEIWESLPDLTINFPDNKMPEMVYTTRSHVKPGMAADYVEVQKERVAAYRKAGIVGSGASRVRLGSANPTFISWNALDKWADMDGESNLAKAMDQQARQAWFAKVLPLIASGSERTVWVYQADLSYHPSS